ncbi:hypothetical protein BDP55DRAFT_766391 [Colletotrichum godetiae]|uniref:Uncharacterized protein n=1 Tax=Colletotrichum godetiae TaxID=1209918 RepID=A0AAJ0AQD8_9PEZI|nr:uncharacterized protein BDP55DRAFT_766391 [Colletotrichum godetiae]KAK1688455.1 hypothetical protein BDP55DRAFT_766391 [Colletotrichum godetiae]
MQASPSLRPCAEPAGSWVVGRPDQGYFLLEDGERFPSLQLAKFRKACRLWAIVEAKDVGKIYRWYEFIKQCFRRGQTGPPTRGSKQDLQLGTVFNGSADKAIGRLLKQAAAYAMIFRTMYVIMTDHATFMFLVFRDMDISHDSTAADLWYKGVGETVEVTLVRPHEGEDFEGPLAGFFAEARKKTPLDTFYGIMDGLGEELCGEEDRDPPCLPQGERRVMRGGGVWDEVKCRLIEGSTPPRLVPAPR